MFKPTKAFNGFSVSNLEQAKSFYQDVLGLTVATSEMSTLDVTGPDGGRFLIYEKSNHTPATYTTLNFLVEDIEGAVADLKSRGVQFESYDFPDLKTDQDNIARGNGPTIAWFTDPAGNILSVIQE
jgi:predicted enzyme related to lactoylglutathione lyase